MSTATYEFTPSSTNDDWDMQSSPGEWDNFGDALGTIPTEHEPSQRWQLVQLGDRLAAQLDELVTPDRQEMALAFATAVGKGAVRGALEGTGLVNIEKDTEKKFRVRPVRLIMGAVRPVRTARKAATGAVKGAKHGAVLGGFRGGLELARGSSREASGTTESYPSPEPEYKPAAGSEWD